MSDKRCGLWRAFGHEVHEGHAVAEDEALLEKQRCSFGVDGLAGCNKVGIEGVDFHSGLGSAILEVPGFMKPVSFVVMTTVSLGGDFSGSCATSHCVSVTSLGGEEVERWPALAVQ